MAFHLCSSSSARPTCAVREYGRTGTTSPYRKMSVKMARQTVATMNVVDDRQARPRGGSEALPGRDTDRRAGWRRRRSRSRTFMELRLVLSENGAGGLERRSSTKAQKDMQHPLSLSARKGTLVLRKY